MGKGTGGCLSKEPKTSVQHPAPAAATPAAPAPAAPSVPAPAPAPAPPAAPEPTVKVPDQAPSAPPEKPSEPALSVPTSAPPATDTTGAMAKIYIIFYSMYGHVYQMAQKVKEGVDSVPGCEGVLYQVAETLPEEVLSKMHAPAKPDVPIVDPHVIAEADGFVFGFPTRFSMMCAQMKSFFDATGQLWQSGALVGKPASMFTSTATQNGGQEVTLLTAVTQLAHHGMIYVPQGYTAGPSMFDMTKPKGGSPYGPGCLAGPDGSRQPSDVELEHSLLMGKRLAEVAKKLKA